MTKNAKAPATVYELRDSLKLGTYILTEDVKNPRSHARRSGFEYSPIWEKGLRITVHGDGKGSPISLMVDHYDIAMTPENMAQWGQLITRMKPAADTLGNYLLHFDGIDLPGRVARGNAKLILLRLVEDGTLTLQQVKEAARRVGRMSPPKLTRLLRKHDIEE